jgi:hypothetical protein
VGEPKELDAFEELGDPDASPAKWALHSGEIVLPKRDDHFRLSVHLIGDLPVPSGRLAIGDVGPSVIVIVPPGVLRVAVTRWEEAAAGWGPRASHLSLLVPGRTEVRRDRLTREQIVPTLRRDPGRALQRSEPLTVTLSVDSGYCWCVDEDGFNRYLHDKARARTPDCLRRQGGADGVAAAIEPLTDGLEPPLAAFCTSGIGDGEYRLFGGFDADGRLAAVHIDFGLTYDYDKEQRRAWTDRRRREEARQELRRNIGCIVAFVGVLLLIILPFVIFPILRRP